MFLISALLAGLKPALAGSSRSEPIERVDTRRLGRAYLDAPGRRQPTPLCIE
jgi:hypothetical protein